MTDKIKNVQLVIDYIEDHLSSKLTLKRISDATYYSKYYLHRMFLDTLGMTIYDYIRRRRLTKAASLLVFSDIAISQIAFLYGYSSQQSFTNIFVEFYKVTPNKYREKRRFYPLLNRFNLNQDLPFSSEKKIKDRKITLATSIDIPMWMDLVNLVIDGFPHFVEKDYLLKLTDYINKEQALIIKDSSIAIGIILFSYNNKSVDFIGIHPLYRKEELSKALFKNVLEKLNEQELSITTYRENDKADNGQRKAIKNLGFVEGELLFEYGYPTQKFILKRGKFYE